MTDKELNELYLAGDETALSRTQELYGAYCVSIARNILGSAKDAEEVVNEVMLKAWEQVPRFVPGNVKTYLGKLTRNAAINRRGINNARKRGGGEDDASAELMDIVSGAEGPEDALIKKELLSAVNDYLASLPGRKRELFVLRYWHYEPLSRLAKRFGVTENSIGVQLHRLRKGLKKYLKDRDLIV